LLVAPVRFDGPPAVGVERREVRYRLVRVCDGRDDLRSEELGRVDRGDEVDILGEEDGYLRIRTPQGVEGWIPRIAIFG
jgi:SH3-like domain-containing protein